MHSIKLNVQDQAYSHIMYFLQSLRPQDVEVLEDIEVLQKKIPASKSVESKYNFDDVFGMWSGRDISVEELRSDAWGRNDSV